MTWRPHFCVVYVVVRTKQWQIKALQHEHAVYHRDSFILWKNIFLPETLTEIKLESIQFSSAYLSEKNKCQKQSTVLLADLTNAPNWHWFLLWLKKIISRKSWPWICAFIYYHSGPGIFKQRGREQDKNSIYKMKLFDWIYKTSIKKHSDSFAAAKLRLQLVEKNCFDSQLVD